MSHGVKGVFGKPLEACSSFVHGYAERKSMSEATFAVSQLLEVLRGQN